MKSTEIVMILKENAMPVFSSRTVSKIINKSKGYTNLSLLRMVKRGMIQRIERDKYFLSDTDIYEVASNILRPSYISTLSALAYHGLTTQIPSSFDVIAVRQHKSIAILGGMINFIKTTKDRIFGFRKERSIFLADPEKAIVDAVYFDRLYYTTINQSLEIGIKKHLLDIEKLGKYAIMMRSKVLLNKLGFMLDENGVSMDYFLQRMSQKYIAVSVNPTKTSKKWRVLYG